LLIFIPTYSSVEAFLDSLLERLSENKIDVLLVCGATLEEVKWDVSNVQSSVQTIFMNIPRGLSPLGLLKSIFRFQQIVKNESPDIIHAHFSIPSLILALVSSKAIKLATYQGLYHTQESGIKAKLIGVLERFSIKKMDVAYVVSEYDKKKVNLPNLYVQPGNGFGVRSELFNPNKFSSINESKRKIGLPTDKRILLFTGRYVPFKGFSILPEILTELHDPSVCLVTCGVIDKLHPIEESLINHPQWIDLGWRQDIAEIMYCSDIFLFPSLREGMPVSLMEAMCMNLPSIVAPVRGSSELIEHLKTGYIVESHTAYQYARGVESILNNEELNENIKRNLENLAPKLNRSNYDSWQVQEYEKVLEKC
jgi:glycosyltransferase involved in cell wall biosynthesis